MLRVWRRLDPDAYGWTCIKFKPTFFGEDGDVRDEFTAKFLRRYMEEYCAFVQRVLAANAPGQMVDLERDADKLSR